ncbi:hypothetical protein DFH11DRAFT_1569469 [Phellopilus nigrolimitatus]|nr:hypothetical protein DFH11DRAFT_1569469 [Phellopilus nigrolimitatus]
MYRHKVRPDQSKVFFPGSPSPAPPTAPSKDPGPASKPGRPCTDAEIHPASPCTGLRALPPPSADPRERTIAAPLAPKMKPTATSRRLNHPGTREFFLVTGHAMQGLQLLASECTLPHGDVSPANILFYHRKGLAVGVLNDFDNHRVLYGPGYVMPPKRKDVDVDVDGDVNMNEALFNPEALAQAKR